MSRSVRAGQGHMADQVEVWAHLACRADELDVDSPPGAIRDLYARLETEMTAARRGSLLYMAGQWGGLDLAGPGLFGRA